MARGSLQSIALRGILPLLGLLALGGCAKQSTGAEEQQKAGCAPSKLPLLTSRTSGGTSSGTARVFMPDPISQTGLRTLAPSSADLDSLPTAVTLQHLGGHGVLEGSYVAVKNGLDCDQWFGAYDPKGDFSYSHSDPRFQEAMTYYYGDQYRAKLDQYGYLKSTTPVTIFAHCVKEDNAFYLKAKTDAGEPIELVCLGDSVKTPGAFYSDDAQVTIHELQHATTGDTYSLSPGVQLGYFGYDEAGALNEAISDFMALTYTEPLLSPSLDPRVFSRWALGTFVSGYSGIRGAHKCPTYDPTYPDCTGYPSFSASNNTISYVYPDGMGWPYANNFKGPGYAASAFNTSAGQEDIHNAATLIDGALWDVYVALKSSNGEEQAHALSSKLVLEAVAHLPRPNSLSASPVTIREMASQMMAYAASVGLTSEDRTAVQAALTARGLLGGTPLTSGWASVGPGNAGVSPGLRIQDSPEVLKEWLSKRFKTPPAVPQAAGAGLNYRLNPGELAAVWFDIQNSNAVTAGGIQVTVTSMDPDVTFDRMINDAVSGNKIAQIQYGKINGTAIVKSLTSGNPDFNVATGNTYFKTDPFFDRSWRTTDIKLIGLPTTALWVRVSPTATHGKTVHFQVEAQPSHGETVTLDFTATIQ